MAGLPTNPTETFIKNNPHLYARIERENRSAVVQAVIKKSRRLRQDSKPLMNKLETEALAYLQRLFPKVVFRCQAKRYKLANGIWYKPDATAQMDGAEFAWEVKGPHAFRGGFENLKFAAAAWPEVTWTLIWKERDQQWRSQRILA